ncbi:MAG: hypothetical protein ACD_31C00005G0014 [uncultured bacterium]|uniref:Glycosyltransferase RgtA/B/C/D-like domain-containing protein n=3 Tax=Candidatus Daviesiibacteriota TaxID=1752718 RepID=A0A0G0HES7_9BACT|nr:MAG: hypothetical protein ACD_31C00005G0014 [uncultured bacterium]KKQ10589.1 MAG: hypothetical protein US19_C0002G0008 [Candidatus Daviesbacteria bacterium GW2011_GWB1_36_5]KKQ15718.1 MAG: hypothetical protein US28_C0011G0014 [Candidatus Daviesbacteria bacterium GW2011_GWA1_36_8]OGE17863.1 MAG: hypothetical protein A2858_03910 [Candidatus Daviesbacteria bacterium RIFCSPHIGHO2_01_FULL_36_37]
MQLIKYIKLELLVLLISSLWLITLFLFNPHYVELTGTLETWFPYKGLTYYKDFAAFHFPLGRLILYPIHLITNWNLEFDPFMALFLGLLNIAVIYTFSKKLLSNIGLSLCLIFFSLFFWYAATGILYFHEILIGVGLTILTLIILRQISHQQTSSLINFSAGLLISLTLLTGQIAAITLAFIFFTQVVINIYSKKTFKNNLFLSLGILIPIIITSLYFYSKEALWHFIEYNITYYILYAGYQKDSLDKLPKELLIYYLPTLLYIVTFFLSSIKKLKFRLQDYFLLTLSLSTIPFVLFSLYHPHHLNYSLPIQALCFGAVFDLQTKLKSYWKIFFTLILITFIYFSYVLILDWHFDRWIFPPDFRIKNDIYPYSSDPMNSAISWVLNNTDSNSKIMVLGDSMFYLRANRLPASRPSKGIPYGWNPFESVKLEIANSPADYWIIERHFYDKLDTIYKQAKMQRFVDDLLIKDYQLVIKYDSWEIWKKN